MGRGVQEVEKGIEESVRSSKSLCLIMDQIASLTYQINHIATVAKEKAATTSEMTSNISQITDVVHATSRGASETAAASSQLSREAEHLQQLVSQLKL